jgi:hypothetical protein
MMNEEKTAHKATLGRRQKEECRMQKMIEKSAKATLMRHQSHIKATPKPVDSQLIGTPEPP